MRLPLDINFVFTANPEDYTNRGAIITPLKDRIESQILTHYPQSIEIAKEITAQEAGVADDQRAQIHMPDLIAELLERIAFAARESEFVDEKSGVSARMSITGMENLFSTAERRMLINKEKKTTARITDFWGIIPSITGKVELVYEGEKEGPHAVALRLLGQAVKDQFLLTFPHPDKVKKKQRDPYGVLRAYFSGSNVVELNNDATNKDYQEILKGVPGLDQLLDDYKISKDDRFVWKELVLHALAEFDVISKDLMQTGINFSDPLSGMLDDLE